MNGFVILLLLVDLPTYYKELNLTFKGENRLVHKLNIHIETFQGNLFSSGKLRLGVHSTLKHCRKM